MRRRPRCCALAAALLVTGCGADPGLSTPAVEESTTPIATESAEERTAAGSAGRWMIGVSGVRDGDTTACEADPMVVEAWQSADYPSSNLGLGLAPDASEADATRITECLRSALPANEVSVRWEAGMMPMPAGPGETVVEPAGPDPSAPLPPSDSSADELPPCDASSGAPLIEEREGTVGAWACGEGEPLTQEEMIDASPMPMPIVPSDPRQGGEGPAAPALPVPAPGPAAPAPSADTE